MSVYFGGGFLRLCKKSGISRPGGDGFGAGDGVAAEGAFKPIERLGGGEASLDIGID